MVDADGNPVTPRAPVDVRIREAALHYLRGIPAFGKPLPSFADSIAYSQEGDWATSDKSVKRALHGVATVLAYLVTYPLVDLLGKARTKPGPFAIAVLIVIAAVSAIVTA